MKKKTIRLNREQQELVTSHLPLIHSVIRKSIRTIPGAFGFEYEDLFQEGCLLLCYAAASFDPSRAAFGTYAGTVVHNGLISYCRRFQNGRRCISFSEWEQAGISPAEDLKTSPDAFACRQSLFETMDLLQSHTEHYHGVAQLGIEALKLQLQGMGITEIAGLYQVPPSHVGAWIARSKKKLKKDPAFLSEIA